MNTKLKTWIMLKAFLILTAHLLLLNSVSSQDKFTEGYVMYSDSSMVEGFVKNFTSNQNMITLVQKGTNKKIRISSKKIEEIGLIIDNEITKFHKHKLVKYRIGYKRVKEYHGICWASKYYQSDKIEVYQYNWKENNAIFIPTSPIFIPYNSKHLTYALKFPNDGFIIDVSGHGGLNEENKMRKKLLKIFSNKCKNIKEANSKTKLETLQQFIEYYEANCS